MSKPWHGEIAALSLLLPDKRQHGRETGQRWWRRRRREEEEEEGRMMREKQSGRRDTRWEDGVKGGGRWRGGGCNKKGGREKGAYSRFRAEGREGRNWEGWWERWETVLGHLMFSLSWHQPLSIHSSSFFSPFYLHFFAISFCTVQCSISLFSLFFTSSPSLPSSPSLSLSSVGLWREVMRETMQTQALWIENGKRTAVGDDSDGC